jgi:hypothetical protein
VPRIRTIKPELWESPDVLPMDDAFQALFCWLISQADDAGRLHTDASHIAYRRRRPVKVVEDRLRQMEARGMVTRYQVEGRPYLELVNWRDHQWISHPSKHVYPAPPNGSGILRSPPEPPRANRAKTRADRTRPEGGDRKGSNPPSPPAGGEDQKIQGRLADDPAYQRLAARLHHGRPR